MRINNINVAIVTAFLPERVVVVVMSGASSARRVKVVVRTKPTATFAHDHIVLESDEKVSGKCRSR